MTSPVPVGAAKRYRHGTHRAQEPAATLARVRPLLPVFGITRIANVTGLDTLGIPVVMVCRPNSRSIAVAQGKGLVLEAAKASGVMEAIETFHGERFHGPLKLAAYEDLRYDHAVVDPALLARPPDSRYDDDQQLLWVEGLDLFGGQAKWLPFEVVHTNYALPLVAGSGCFSANTNGLASGNTWAEAVCHGICEVIERDATTLWMLSDAAARRGRLIDPATIDDEDCRTVIDRFAAAAVDLCIWETTTDIGVAAFVCLAMSGGGDGVGTAVADPEFGAGCHPAREIALLRALTEAAQARTTFIVGARDDLGPAAYSPAQRRRRAEEARALLDGGQGQRSFAAAPGFATDTFEDDVALLLDRLREAGIGEVMVVDLTKPAFRIPVVRVVIPGLEGPFEGDGATFHPGSRALRLAAAADGER
jgi:YcaO-like protein with predicted kinase domain